MTDQKVISDIAAELQLPTGQVKSAVTMLQDGNTIPFIARYRKEATKGLNEIQLRQIEDALERANALAARRATVLKSIEDQGLLTADLKKSIVSCQDLRSLEAIYLPFKPKRRTRATIAREQGLQPLADLLMAQERIGQTKNSILKPFINASNDLPDTQSVLAGGFDIVAEQWSENAEVRKWLFDKAMKFGKIYSKVKRGKKSADGAAKFEQYFDRQESVARLPGHRLLAMMRGASEKLLNIGLLFEGDREVSDLKRKLVINRDFEFFHDMLGCAEDCFARLLLPATESTLLQQLKENADDGAIQVFGQNLEKLLMAAPAGPRVTIGIDPGFRTGCKVAVIDATGQFLKSATIFPTAPKNDVDGATKTLLRLIQEFDVELIAIGNGTASRETDMFVSKMIKQQKCDLISAIVSEAGASVYSASDIAVKEFPDLDITVRGAISIARRLQDPLAELVKSDPKSIGVGQYQHDVNQPKLKKCLDRVVESCVNQVGVDLNMASAPLLSYVAGIGPKLAENIVDYRNVNGKFDKRRDLLAVSKLGKKAFEQAAGFLRISGGGEPLDNSAVHPECYSVAQKMAKHLKSDLKSLVGNTSLPSRLSPTDFVTERFGELTIKDIIAELAKPTRDPRNEFKSVRFDDKVNSVSDLKKGMVLEGIISNVTHFGAFIDIGVHQDALIHISQLADQFVNDPNEVVAVGDVVKVKILDIESGGKRIAATRKF
jgi:uncharacterized protein